jgi:hypothetical protein
MPTWTNNEDEILKKYYSDTPKNKLLKLLPRHSWFSIRVRANHILSLKREKALVTKAKGLTPWTEEEIETLRNLYPVAYTEEIMAALPNRTWSAIETFARDKLKIRRCVDRIFGPVKPLQISEVDKAYIAGMVDGDGSICLYRDPKKGYVISKVSIVNNDLSVLEWIQSITKLGRIQQPTKHKATFSLTINRNSNQIAFLEAILPHLKVKKPHAEVTLAFLRARRNRRRLALHDEKGRIKGVKIVRDPTEEELFKKYCLLKETRLRQAKGDKGKVTHVYSVAPCVLRG